ncbi:protein kinase family protein [Pseudonocardia acaciae]|uniref:protein kinase family protein n=1 Tax=Pseudonocardia acaciae TaxID=551276 RepID=UPI00048E2D2B|nr:protein kinase family protein [Pseudonocardia acaciae]
MSGHTGQRSAAESGDSAPADPPPPGAVTPAPSVPAPRPSGTVIAERYQLLAQVGSDDSVNAAFWRARDTILARDVALTLLQATGDDGEAERAAEMITKALRWGKFEHPGCARLLDVMPGGHHGLPEDVLGLAVTEWVPGRSLAETVRAWPLRTATLLGMLDPLAKGAEAAHRQGLVLGCAHPQRIRITPDGSARLAFALPHPDATPADDVRGLGAVLYTLLTGHWPLSNSEAELAGLPPAPRDVQGVVVPPGLVRPGVSVEVSALALGALGAGASHGRVHTAAGVHKVVAELMDSEQEVALLPPPDDGTPAAADEVWKTSTMPPTVDPERRRKLSLALGGLGVLLLGVLGYLGVQVGSLLGVTPPSAPRIIVAGPQAPAPAAETPPAPGAPAAPPPAPALPPDPGREAVVHPASVRVFDPTGDPDNSGRISRLVDDDPRSSWSTYIYKRPFPALKPGVGVMVSFASPVQLSRLTIASPSTGSRIEIRSAPAPDATFAQTIQIGETTVNSGTADVPLTGSQPVQNVLVWITKLGGGGDQNVTEIGDLRFERVTG